MMEGFVSSTNRSSINGSCSSPVTFFWTGRGRGGYDFLGRQPWDMKSDTFARAIGR